MCLAFQGESGVGEGVTKDIYDKFFHCFYEKGEGYNEKVPAATILSEELEIFGKIVTHAFFTIWAVSCATFKSIFG